MQRFLPRTTCAMLLAMIAAGCLPATRTTNLAHTDARTAIDRARQSLPAIDARRKILDEAEQWLGTPYLFGGVSRSGVDCSGFVCNAFRAAGRTLPRTSAAMSSVGTPVELAQSQPGDLVFFNTMGSGVSHVGILLTPYTFIHASTSSGVTVSSLQEEYYRSHVMFARHVID